MKCRAYLIYICMIFLLISCASGRKAHFSEKKLADLVESFDLNKDEFAKFRTEPTEEIQVVDEIVRPQTVDISKKAAKEEPKRKAVEIKQSTPVLKPRPKKVKEIVKVKIPEKKIKPGKKKGALPEGYPKFLIGYDEKSKNVWKTHKPNVEIGEKFVFQITYLGISVGHVQMTSMDIVKVANKDAYHFRGRLKSSEYYEMLYKLDDSVDSYIDVNTFLPIKYSLRQRESGKDVDDLQLYDQESLKTYAWYKRVKKGQIKKWEKSAFIPYYFQDLLSVMYFVRGLKFKKGLEYQVPIVTRGKIYRSVIKYKGLDDVKAQGKWWKAHLIAADIFAPKGKEKKGTVLFWITPNKKRRFLAFEGNFKMSFSGELVEYVPGKRNK